jgi:hypothetical protein
MQHRWSACLPDRYVCVKEYDRVVTSGSCGPATAHGHVQVDVLFAQGFISVFKVELEFAIQVFRSVRIEEVSFNENLNVGLIRLPWLTSDANSGSTPSFETDRKANPS